MAEMNGQKLCSKMFEFFQQKYGKYFKNTHIYFWEYDRDVYKIPLNLASLAFCLSSLM